MRLLLVELDRLRSRRAVALVVLAATLLTAVLAVTAIWDTRPYSADERAAAQAQADNIADNPLFQRDLAECHDSPSSFLGPDTNAADCEEFLLPQAEDFLARNQLDLSLVSENRGVAAVVLVTALLLICGATFAGGDWATGSMSNQLLFRPRRAQVWLAKAGAVLIGAAVVSAVLLVGFWVALYLTAESRGIVTADPVLADIGWLVARGTALATAAALGGYALTMLLRSTVATLAALFAYAVVGEALVMALPLERASQWSLAHNVFAWIGDGTTIYDPDIVCPPGRGGCIQSYELELVHGAAYLGVLLLVAVVVSLLVFRRRDVA